MTDARAAQSRFAAMLAKQPPPSGGLSLSAIEREVAPVLSTLVEGTTAGEVQSFYSRECFTLSTLLGRRLALLDLTPTATLRVVELLLASVAEQAGPSAARFGDQLRAAIIEGFVIGREERVSDQAAKGAAAPIRPLRLDASILLLAVTGEHAPEALSQMVDALGRDMLDANANVALVDLTQLAAPNRERARAMLAADEMTRMLGAVCVFSGVDARWEAAAGEARVPIENLHRTATFREGLALARSIADSARVVAPPKWRALLERFRR